MILWCVWVTQVRDVLKGALKPTCLSDTESELAGYSWQSAAVRRQFSEGSAHRSVTVLVVVVVTSVVVVVIVIALVVVVW